MFTDSAASVISCSLSSVAVMLVRPRLLQQPFAGELVGRHAVGVGVSADQLELLQAVDFPRLIAELAVVVGADGGVELDLVLEDRAVVVDAGEDAGVLGAGQLAELAAGVLLEEVEDGLHGLGVVLEHRLEALFAPADGRAERDAPDA